MGISGGSLVHLVQCRSNELSWTWTQTWVQAWVPDYSLNWTTKSSAILDGQWPLHAHPAKRQSIVQLNFGKATSQGKGKLNSNLLKCLRIVCHILFMVEGLVNTYDIASLVH